MTAPPGPLRELLAISDASTEIARETGWPIAPAGAEAGADCYREEFPAFAEGWYAFEGALHVYGTVSTAPDRPSAWAWNDPTLWTSHYGDMTSGLFFFAEDAFGAQFALAGREVFTFEPETGQRTALATGIEAWADIVLKNYSYLTAHPLARAWQSENRALRPGERLLPITPFILGGTYTTDNLRPVPAVLGMRRRARLARDTAELDEGSPYELGAWWDGADDTEAAAGVEGR